MCVWHDCTSMNFIYIFKSTPIVKSGQKNPTFQFLLIYNLQQLPQQSITIPFNYWLFSLHTRKIHKFKISHTRLHIPWSTQNFTIRLDLKLDRILMLKFTHPELPRFISKILRLKLYITEVLRTFLDPNWSSNRETTRLRWN